MRRYRWLILVSCTIGALVAPASAAPSQVPAPPVVQQR
jgi:hypothetical protein